MNDIRSLISLARRRLEMSAFLRSLHRVGIVVAIIALVLAVLDRLPAEAFLPWTWMAPVLLVIALGAAVLVWRRRRLSDLQVAVAVDDRLHLRERLSTAMHCQNRDDPFAQAAVEDAVETARDPRSWETTRRRFRVHAPRQWWISPLLLVVAGSVLFLNQANLFADDDAESVREARVETDEAIRAIVRTVEAKPELREELAGLVEDLAGEQADADHADRPEDVKRTALKKVTELNRKLDDILNGQKGKTEEALKNMLSGLQPPEEGSARELAEALSKGNFQDAKKALEKMLADIETGELDEEQQKKLAEQLADIANQLEQLAQQQKALKEALERAGLNPQLANNPQALQQAIDQAQNMNEQQKQQLQQMMQAQQAAQKMCEGLGGACQQMAQNMQAGSKMGAGQGMMNQLDAMEQLQQLLQQAQAAANECQGQGMGLGQGMNMNDALKQWGPGMGRRGQGFGGQAPMTRTPTGSRIVKVDVPTVDGEIIASMLIDGSAVRGESKAKIQEVVDTMATGFDEALNENPLPRRYDAVQKHYFGELQKQVEAIRVAEEEAETAPAPAEGSSPSDAGSGG